MKVFLGVDGHSEPYGTVEIPESELTSGAYVLPVPGGKVLRYRVSTLEAVMPSDQKISSSIKEVKPRKRVRGKAIMAKGVGDLYYLIFSKPQMLEVVRWQGVGLPPVGTQEHAICRMKMKDGLVLHLEDPNDTDDLQPLDQINRKDAIAKAGVGSVIFGEPDQDDETIDMNPPKPEDEEQKPAEPSVHEIWEQEIRESGW